MRYSKAFASAVIVATLIAVGSTGSGPAEATQRIDSARISGYLNDAGVSHKDANKVIDKIRHGEQLDFETDQKPVSVETERKGDWEVTTEIYPDGSAETTEIEKPLEITSATSISAHAGPTNCKVKGGSGYRSYTNCHVRRTNPLYNLGFKASYTIVQSGKDYIGGVHGLETKCYAGTCSKSKLNTTRKRETASAKATAKASTVYKTYASSSSRNVWLKLWVGKNKATITKN